MNLEVIFLGVGAAIPLRGGTNCAYLIRANDRLILFDCGPAILQQLDAVGISPDDITDIFVSHRHGDHALGLPMLILWRAIHTPNDKPRLIASDITHDSLRVVLSHAYGDEFVMRFFDAMPKTRLAADRADSALIGDHIRATTLPMQHSTFAPVLGLRLEWGNAVIAFTADTASCDNIALLARSANLLVHDANYAVALHPQFAEGGHGHSTARQAAQHAQQARAAQLALVHLDRAMQDHFQSYINEARAVFDGHVFVPTAGDTVRITA